MAAGRALTRGSGRRSVRWACLAVARCRPSADDSRPPWWAMTGFPSLSAWGSDGKREGFATRLFPAATACTRSAPASRSRNPSGSTRPGRTSRPRSGDRGGIQTSCSQHWISWRLFGGGTLCSRPSTPTGDAHRRVSGFAFRPAPSPPQAHRDAGTVTSGSEQRTPSGPGEGSVGTRHCPRTHGAAGYSRPSTGASPRRRLRARWIGRNYSDA